MPTKNDVISIFFLFIFKSPYATDKVKASILKLIAIKIIVNCSNYITYLSIVFYLINYTYLNILEIKSFKKNVYSTSSSPSFSIIHNGGNKTHQKLLPSAFPISTTNDS